MKPIKFTGQLKSFFLLDQRPIIQAEIFKDFKNPLIFVNFLGSEISAYLPCNEFPTFQGVVTKVIKLLKVSGLEGTLVHAH